MEADLDDDYSDAYVSELDEDEISLNGIIERDNLEKFKETSDARKSVNFITDKVSTLSLALGFESHKIYKFLTAIPDPDIDIRTRNRTALLFQAIFRFYVARDPAERQNVKRFIIYIINKGADVNLRSAFGYGPLYAACCTGLDECIFMLITYGARPNPPTREAHLPLHAAAAVYCPSRILDTLFYITFDTVGPPILHIMTLTQIVKHNHLAIVHRLLPFIAAINVPTATTDLVRLFISHLTYVPFPMFTEFTQRGTKIVDHIRRLRSLDLTWLFDRNPDAMDYLAFFWTHCQNLREFNLVALQLIPDHISYDLLSGITHRLLTRHVLLEVDLDLLYARYQFSPLLEMLLHRNVDFLKDPDAPCFVPVWYNTRLASAAPLFPLPEFADGHQYFAEPGTVPKLLQLSRDAYRFNLLQHFDVNDSVHWAAIIHALDIPEPCKNMLKFKRRLY